MLVAIIDDGIIPELFGVPTLFYDMVVTRWGIVRKRYPFEYNMSFHGSTVMGIINKYAPNVEFCSIRIFSGGIMRSTCKQLVSALYWCLKKNVPIINLSLGTTNPDDFNEIQKVVDKLISKGQIIIAAGSNSGKYTMPAFYRGVLGVKVDETLIDNQLSINNESTGAMFRASSHHKLCMRDGSVLFTGLANSYADPTVTGYVCNLLNSQGYNIKNSDDIFKFYNVLLKELI